MTDMRGLGWVRSFGTRGAVSVVGILFSVFLFPKLAPVWLLHFLGGIGSILNIGITHLLYGMTNREWIIGAAFVGGYIKNALGEIEEERAFTEAERDALEAFAADIGSMPIRNATTMGSSAAVLTKAGTDVDQLRKIRTQYRETVMSVPNYESVYGDSFVESFAAEFGDDLAQMVTNGTQFTRPAQELLLKQTSTAVTEREQHLDALATERQSVATAGRRLNESQQLVERTDPRNLLHCSFEELLEYESAICCTTEDHHQLLKDRQRDIHNSNRRAQHRSELPFLQEYLYESLNTSFPVLSAALERINTLGDRRRAVIRSIARRY